MRDIAIVSPHLDDAVLSMADHLMQWRTLGKSVDIITVFSSFKSDSLSHQAKTFLKRANTLSVSAYERMRKREDMRACAHLCDLKQLMYLDFVDAAFRSDETEVLYPTRDTLFSGRCRDTAIYRNVLRATLKELLKKYSQIYVPVGIGNHIDHILVRDTVTQLFPPSHYGFYVDYPYALACKHWSLMQIVTHIQQRKSILPPTLQKRKALSQYTSQLPLLFSPGVPQYSEIVYQPSLSL